MEAVLAGQDQESEGPYFCPKLKVWEESFDLCLSGLWLSQVV